MIKNLINHLIDFVHLCSLQTHRTSSWAPKVYQKVVAVRENEIKFLLTFLIVILRNGFFYGSLFTSVRSSSLSKIVVLPWHCRKLHRLFLFAFLPSFNFFLCCFHFISSQTAREPRCCRPRAFRSFKAIFTRSYLVNIVLLFCSVVILVLGHHSDCVHNFKTWKTWIFLLFLIIREDVRWGCKTCFLYRRYNFPLKHN